MSNLAHFGTLWLAQHTFLYWSETVTWTGDRLLSTKGKEYLRCSSCQKTRQVIEISTPDTTWLFSLSRAVIYVGWWRLQCLAGRTVLKIKQPVEASFLKQVQAKAKRCSGLAAAGWAAGSLVHPVYLEIKVQIQKAKLVVATKMYWLC